MKTILLIDDSRFFREMTERTLVRAGYNVVTARDGEEGLRLACESVPDLILLDMLLPKLTGPQVLRSLRTTPHTARVPVVVLGSLPQSNEPQLIKDGATAYFDKSTLGIRAHSESLIQILKKILDEYSQHNGDADFTGVTLPVFP